MTTLFHSPDPITGPVPKASPNISIPSPADVLKAADARECLALILDRLRNKPLREADALNFGGFADHEPAPKPSNTLSYEMALACACIAQSICRNRSVWSDIVDHAGAMVLTLPDGLSIEAVHQALEATFTDAGAATLGASRRNGRRRSEPPLSDSLSIGELDDRASTVKHLPVMLMQLRDEATSAFVLAQSGMKIPVAVHDAVDSVHALRFEPALFAIVLGRVLDEEIDQAATAALTAQASGMTIADLRKAFLRRGDVQQNIERLKVVAAAKRPPTTALKLEDLHGYGDARDIGLGIARDLAQYAIGKIEWADIEPGLLLVGAPSTGKTLFAQALAGSADVPLVQGSLARWQAYGSGHLGDLLAAMTQTFDDARNSAPCVLLLDEVDSFGRRDGFRSKYSDYSIQVVNSLLEQLDGVESRDGVFVVGATNLPERLDPALIRSGRLDRKLVIDLPDEAGLVGILQHHLSSADITGNLAPVARRLRGSTPADAASVVRRAKGVARRDGRSITIGDLLDAAKEGRQEPSGKLRWRIAVHESGHAVAANALHLGSVKSLVIDHRGGRCEMEPKHAAPDLTAHRVKAELVRLLAGRAAEILIIGAPSAGSGIGPESDLARATTLATHAIGEWGLFDDLVWRSGSINETADIEPAVHVTLEDAMRRATDLIARHRTVLLRLARELHLEGYLNAGKIKLVLDPPE